jgi:hypothetical protein
MNDRDWVRGRAPRVAGMNQLEDYRDMGGDIIREYMSDLLQSITGVPQFERMNQKRNVV